MISMFPNRPSSFEVSELTSFGNCAVGIIVGLSSAGVAFHVVSIIGIAISSADTVGELHIGWFPIRVLVALRMATASSGWAYGMLSRKR